MVHRLLVRSVVAGAVVGGSFVGAAWAGVGVGPLGPVPVPTVPPAVDAVTAAEAARPDRPPAGEWSAGASVRSIAPDPERWQREGCSEYASNVPEEVTHLADKAVADQVGSWPKSPDCVYLGGYGLGPARAATGVDPHAGVNVRSIALSNGTPAGTVVWQVVDLVGFFSSYRADLCQACGIADIRATVADRTGIPVANLAVGSTHTHGGADGYGAWGGLPTWYREQVRDAVIASAVEAVAALRPATITIGQVDARSFNNERRATYHSSPDYGAVWLQATGRRSVIATLVNYAAHPTVLGAQPLLHGDWPATASKALGDQLGGVGLVVEGGLGNVSPARPRDGGDEYDDVIAMGDDFAAYVGADIARGGTALASTEVKVASAPIEHPVTNWAEAGLGLTGLLDREFTPGDAAGVAGTWSGGKSASRPCSSAAPLTIKTEVSGFRLGELTVLTAPGEIFSTIAQVLKSKVRHGALAGGQTMVFGQTQDALGYIIPSFEVDPAGGALTNASGDTFEYEETFMLDRCFGDHVLQAALEVGASLK